MKKKYIKSFNEVNEGARLDLSVPGQPMVILQYDNLDPSNAEYDNEVLVTRTGRTSQGSTNFPWIMKYALLSVPIKDDKLQTNIPNNELKFIDHSGRFKKTMDVLKKGNVNQAEINDFMDKAFSGKNKHNFNIQSSSLNDANRIYITALGSTGGLVAVMEDYFRKKYKKKAKTITLEKIKFRDIITAISKEGFAGQIDGAKDKVVKVIRNFPAKYKKLELKSRTVGLKAGKNAQKDTDTWKIYSNPILNVRFIDKYKTIKDEDEDEINDININSDNLISRQYDGKITKYRSNFGTIKGSNGKTYQFNMLKATHKIQELIKDEKFDIDVSFDLDYQNSPINIISKIQRKQDKAVKVVKQPTQNKPGGVVDLKISQFSLGESIVFNMANRLYMLFNKIYAELDTEKTFEQIKNVVGREKLKEDFDRYNKKIKAFGDGDTNIKPLEHIAMLNHPFVKMCINKYTNEPKETELIIAEFFAFLALKNRIHKFIFHTPYNQFIIRSSGTGISTGMREFFHHKYNMKEQFDNAILDCITNNSVMILIDDNILSGKDTSRISKHIEEIVKNIPYYKDRIKESFMMLFMYNMNTSNIWYDKGGEGTTRLFTKEIVDGFDNFIGNANQTTPAGNANQTTPASIIDDDDDELDIDKANIPSIQQDSSEETLYSPPRELEVYKKDGEDSIKVTLFLTDNYEIDFEESHENKKNSENWTDELFDGKFDDIIIYDEDKDIYTKEFMDFCKKNNLLIKDLINLNDDKNPIIIDFNE